MPHRDWVDLLEAFGPLLACLVALLIGAMQWWLQKRQLKQDRFDRLLSVYQGVLNYVVALLRGEAEPEHSPSYRQFRAETDPGEFLFGADIWDYIKGIGEIGLRFRRSEREMKAHRVLSEEAIIPPDPVLQKRRDAATVKYCDAEQEHERLMSALIGAIEGGVKSKFTKDLQIR